MTVLFSSKKDEAANQLTNPQPEQLPGNSADAATNTGGGTPPAENPAPIIVPGQEPQPQQNPQQTPQNPAEKPAETEADKLTGMQNQTQDFLKGKGFEPASLEKEWAANNGKLSEDTYKKFAELGLSKELVDSHASMMSQMQSKVQQQAVADYQTAMDAHTGSRQNTAQLVQYLKSGAVPINEAVVLNQQLASGNAEQGKMALTRIQNLMQSRFGQQGSLIEGDNTPAPAGTPNGMFSNLNEVMQEARRINKLPRFKAEEQSAFLDRLAQTNNWRKARGLPRLDIPT